MCSGVEATLLLCEVMWKVKWGRKGQIGDNMLLCAPALGWRCGSVAAARERCVGRVKEVFSRRRGSVRVACRDARAARGLRAAA